MGEFLVSFCLPVLFAVWLVLGLVLGVGGGCGSVANIELNFCRMLIGNLLLTGSFPGMGFLGRLLLGVIVTKGWVGSGGCGCSIVLGGVDWLVLGVVGWVGGGWLGGITKRLGGGGCWCSTWLGGIDWLVLGVVLSFLVGVGGCGCSIVLGGVDWLVPFI